MNLSKEELKIIANYFKSKPVLRAFVFGSYSRMEALEDSDLDLLVELDYSKHIGLEFVNMKFELEDRLNKKIDLVTSHSLSEYILPFVEKDKKLIYER